MSETVIREVTKGVWTFSRFGIWPIGGRSTAIQLRGGDLWILASTPLDTDTKAKLDELGPVKYIIGADAVHHLYLSEFKKAYPAAKVIAPKDAIERHGDKDLKFDGVWGQDPPQTKYGFEDEARIVSPVFIAVEHCYFSGFKNKDVAFLHKDSKSLIEADLLMNLPCNEQYSKTTKSASFFGLGGFGPSSWIHSKLTANMALDDAAMRRDAKTVDSWDFERIIPCHGDVIERDGKQAWRDAYKFFLN